MIFTPLQKLPNNVGNLGEIILSTCFEWLPKLQKNHPIWSHCSSVTENHRGFLESARRFKAGREIIRRLIS